MAYQDGNKRAAPAAADLSLKQYLGVVMDNTGKIAVNAVAGGDIVGVLVDDPKAGEQATYQVYDVAKVMCGAAVAAGAKLQCTTAGKFITAATTGHVIVATAREAGSGDGSVIAAEIGYRGII